MNKNQNNQPNQEKNNKAEEKTFQIKIDRFFYDEIGKDQVFEQLKSQAWAYFQNVNWYITEASSKEENNQITFTIKTTGEKGIWKETKDEAETEKKSMWQKAKEKVGLNK
ncbi:MAG: hypothetical protein mread185_000391 [Mycoplasmataceae bacterium]|nr:MAG: hypothetical protein mread185_000391 [Mycoplasmataceae bacterium]